jgi:hypothetical protein
VVEDKNAPKQIVVDYPEIHFGNNYMIFEKNYNQMKQSIMDAKNNLGVTAIVSKKPIVPPKELTADEKKAARLREIQE